MCLAHWQALQVLLGSGGDLASQGLSRTDVVGELAHLVLHGPPALGASQELHDMLHRVVAQLREGEAYLASSTYGMLLHARHSLHLAAMLLSSGLLCALVADLAAWSDHEAALRELPSVTSCVEHIIAAYRQIQDEDIPKVSVQQLLDAATERFNSMAPIRVGQHYRADMDALHKHMLLWQQLGSHMLEWLRHPEWHRPEAQRSFQLELAQAAAARSCAYLRCANLGGEGGPAAGQGLGSMRCSKCRAVWYCGTACSHADWRAGHRRVCKALGAARQAEKERRQAAAAAGQQDEGSY